jgi:hypothetical protein
MKQGELAQGVHQTQGAYAATRATPSGSDLKIYKLGRGAVKYHPGSELASSIEQQEVRSHPHHSQKAADLLDYTNRYAINTA